VAGCGPHDFAMRATPNLGYRLRLRLRQIRPEESPILFWENDGYSLHEAKARAERLANQRVPAIVKGERP
jgi:hypothetical protein